ncbi:MAG: hypothetical protein V1839_02160 [archaeon]
MKPYFVLYKRDTKTEKEENYGDKMLYDRCKFYVSLENARKFFLSNLPAILAQAWPLTGQDKPEIKESYKPYVVAAMFLGKYKSCSMGEEESMETFDAVRCSEADLESTIERFSNEVPKKVFVGVELKLLGGSK